MSLTTAESSLAPGRIPMLTGPLRGSTLHVDAADVTGTLFLQGFPINPAVNAQTVARSLASEMQLQTDVPWALRDERTGAYLDDAKPVGDQLPETGAKVSLVPKAHLGRA
jgi:hypothetical protein